MISTLQEKVKLLAKFYLSVKYHYQQIYRQIYSKFVDNY